MLIKNKFQSEVVYLSVLLIKVVDLTSFKIMIR